PVLCLLLLKKVKPLPDNFLVRSLKQFYLWQLRACLNHRNTTILAVIAVVAGTACLIPRIGREFMPELEEGNVYVRSTAPLNQTLERNVEIAKQARAIMASYPEVEAIVSQSGRPDDGTDTAGYENTEFFLPLRPRKQWPAIVEQKSRLKRWIYGDKRQRTKEELVSEMNAELERKIPGGVWKFSQNIRDNVMEALSGVKGDNSVKIVGPDLDQLELLATKVRNQLQQIQGIENVGILHVRGQSHLEFRADSAKCQKWGVQTADVNNVVASAL